MLKCHSLTFSYNVSGTTQTFNCPECRTRTRVPLRGCSGFRDNVYLQELLDLQKQLPQQKYGQYFCENHMQPYLLFCEEPDCQLQMCAQCSVQHHQGHNLVDIENKASVIKQDLKGMKRDTKEIERIWNLHDVK